MSKKVLYGIIVLVAVAAGWYWYAGQGSEATPSAAVVLNADAYPLYAGTTWGRAVATTSPDYGQVTIVKSTAATDTMNIAAVSTPFTKYY